MSVSLDDLIRRFRAAMSENDPEFFTDSNVTDWLNEAQDVVWADSPFTAKALWEVDSTDTMPGAQYFLCDPDCAIPTGMLIRSTTGGLRSVDYIEPDRMDRLRRGIATTGSPRLYTVRLAEDGPAIEFFPALSSARALYVEGFRRPTVLAVGEDRTDLPRHLVPPIIKYALMCAKDKDEETRQSQEHERRFGTELDLVSERRMQLQADQHNTVKYRRSNRWPYGPLGGEG
jgi:hypothetical protein